ncbi:MAG: HipA N-terminal domain-containing protein [bacterium]
MITKAKVFFNKILAGILVKDETGYQFKYDSAYLSSNLPAISITMPKQVEVYYSKNLFPFFFGLLSEGENKTIICKTLKIDENDYYTLLLKTAHSNTIGAVTVEENNE